MGDLPQIPGEVVSMNGLQQPQLKSSNSSSSSGGDDSLFIYMLTQQPKGQL
jgi:hypothetical protein